MPEIPRLNPAIRALESGKPAFVTFSPAEIGAAQSIGAAAYDGVVFEMEHNPYDIRQLRDCMQYMLDRAQILKSGSLAPAVAPFVRIPPNGGEMNQFIAKQVLDIGVYGIVWPHIDTVEDAYNAVAAMRYARRQEDPIRESPREEATRASAIALEGLDSQPNRGVLFLRVVELPPSPTLELRRRPACPGDPTRLARGLRVRPGGCGRWGVRLRRLGPGRAGGELGSRGGRLRVQDVLHPSTRDRPGRRSGTAMVAQR